MPAPTALTVRTFSDRAESLAHFFLRAGESPRLLAWDDSVGCAMETALSALEWSGVVGILGDDDLLLAAKLNSEVAIAMVERRSERGSVFVYLGPRLDTPPIDAQEGTLLFDEPGVRALQFPTRAMAMAHFLRATSGTGALVNLLSRRGPEVRHVRRWLGAIIHELDAPRALLGGWFAASTAGCLFSGDCDGEPTWRYIEVGLDS